MLLLLLLLLPLLWGIKCVGGQGYQAGAGAPTNLWSPKGSWGLDDRYQLQVQKSVTVQEGLCVFTPCTFSYPTSYWRISNPVLGSWFRKVAGNINHNSDAPVATNDPHREVKEETKGRFQLLGDPRNGSCSLVIRDAQMKDTAAYIFRVERNYYVKFSFVTHPLSLEVTGLTQKPSIYLPETLELGRPVTLLCVFPGNSEGCPDPTFSWTGAAVSPQGAGPRTSLFSEFTLTPRPQDHDTELTCRVDFSRNGVSTSRTILLNVTRVGLRVLGSEGRHPKTGSSAGERERGGEFVQAAFMGAGLTTLLFLCPCLIFLIVKPRKRKATKTAAGVLDVPSVLGTIAWGHWQESRPRGPPDCQTRAVAPRTSGEELELQYASLVFHGLRPWEPQGQEGTSTTEYSEIKTCQ
ncbi:sialic acid-binding Ig-like lectin 11 [Elephas maximus indicus]|uniref:sialic acid-binding Ig-like lectin 11 n=1 Tax=Elephas maximus indicus TaxID=99487 RepID=UPI002115F621|nr:sialic acid-binding Ig-like lectin 11 [Elephas maximus indicus]